MRREKGSDSRTYEGVQRMGTGPTWASLASLGTVRHGQGSDSRLERSRKSSESGTGGVGKVILDL